MTARDGHIVLTVSHRPFHERCIEFIRLGVPFHRSLASHAIDVILCRPFRVMLAYWQALKSVVECMH